MTLYSRTGSRRRESGKFRSYARTGVKENSGQEYRGWSYRLITHQTGSSVRRTLFSVSICDPHMNRVAYLRDFSNTRQAEAAAKAWVDNMLSRLALARFASVGRIPALPTRIDAQDPITAQEK